MTHDMIAMCAVLATWIARCRWIASYILSGIVAYSFSKLTSLSRAEDNDSRHFLNLLETIFI